MIASIHARECCNPQQAIGQVCTKVLSVVSKELHGVRNIYIAGGFFGYVAHTHMEVHDSGLLLLTIGLDLTFSTYQLV